MAAPVVPWPPDRLPELVDLAAHALPGEDLTADELQAVCWDEDGSERSVVLGLDDGSGAVAVAVRRPARDRGLVAVVTAVAVSPAAQGEGRGRRLLDAAHQWAFDESGADAVVAGGLAPFYLWPGVDVRFTRALCLVDAAGYRTTGLALNLSCPVTFRARPPDSTELRRVLEQTDADAVLELCRRAYPRWEAETARGIEHGACHAAFAAGDGGAVGFACHSVNRAGWVGPIGVDPERQRGGVGAALLSALCVDLQVAGRRDAEIAWIGPIRFYARTAGAAVSRAFTTAVLARP